MANPAIQSPPQDRTQTAPPHKSGGTGFLYLIGGFLFAALLAALCWFWYAGHHSISATPQQGPTGVGGMTAGDKGQKKP
ncbi:hypothetical protein [Terriglobus sp.]|uniref:hypothetical protein n=1 Tax=Terriglobus sp. TaxID=1889013 RepID=UPI003B0033DD